MLIFFIFILNYFEFVQTGYFYKHFFYLLILCSLFIFWYVFYNTKSRDIPKDFRYFRHIYIIIVLILLISSTSSSNRSPLIASEYFLFLILQMFLFSIIYEYYFSKNWIHAQSEKNLLHFSLYYSIGLFIFSSVINFDKYIYSLEISILIILLIIVGIYVFVKSLKSFLELLNIKDTKNIELIFILYLGIIVVHVLIYSLYSSEILFVLNDQKALVEMKNNVIDYWVNLLYFGFATSTSLGYGELHPTSWRLKLIVVEELLFSYIMLGVFISKLTNYYIKKR